MAKKRSRRVGGFDWPIALPSFGVLGLIAWFALHVWRLSTADRADYQKAVDAMAKRHDTQIKELHDQIDKMRDRHAAQISKLEGEIKELRAEVDRERTARHTIDLELARYRRLTGGDADEPAN